MSEKVAMITGGATGIGRSVTLDLVKKGYAVVVVYNTSAAKAEALKKEIEAGGGKCLIAQADVSNEEDAVRVVDLCEKEFGRLDVLVNSAGTTKFIPLKDLDSVHYDSWDPIMKTNVVGVFNFCREGSKLINKSGGGTIINIASLSATRVTGSCIPYCLSKAAVVQLTKILAVNLAPSIRVNCVSPGNVVNTDWHRDHEGFNLEAYKAKNDAKIPIGRVATPEDVANVVMFLASEEGSYLNGVNIIIDGGRSEVHV